MDSSQTYGMSGNNTVNNTLTVVEIDDYDSYGAMLFIIAVIIVYGVAVICMLGFYSGRKVQLEDFDKQANNFLKEVDDRHRQLDIRSRKSAFTKRLSELRSELSHDQGPHIQSHVANYLIASIGMKGKGNRERGLNISPINIKRESCTTSRTHSVKSARSNNAGLTNTHRGSKNQIPIVRITDNNKIDKGLARNFSPEIRAREPYLINHQEDTKTCNSHRSYISMRGNSIETPNPQELIFLSGSMNSVLTSDSRLTRLKQNFLDIFDCIPDSTSSRGGSGYLVHSPEKALSGRHEECEGLVLVEYETVV